MSLLYSYLFPAMWVSYSAYWWAMSKDVKETERQEAASSRLTRLALIICAFALLWLPSVPLALLNRRFLPDGSLVLLEWRGNYRRWSTLFGLGAPLSGKKLEPGRHPEGRSRTRYERPLRAGSPSHLYRTPAGISRLRCRPWRMAWPACGRPRVPRAVAQTTARRGMDARPLRRLVCSLLSTCRGAGATHPLSAIPRRAGKYALYFVLALAAKEALNRFARTCRRG